MSGEVVSTEGDNKALGAGSRTTAEVRSDLCEWQYLTEHPEHTRGPGHISHIMLRLATDVPALLAELASRDQALDQIRALHPTEPRLDAFGRLANGCANHGLSCKAWRILSDLSEHQEEAK
jgi:hypothetical protein